MKIVLYILLAVMSVGLIGCRSVGPSGYKELNEREIAKLKREARAILLKRTPRSNSLDQLVKISQSEPDVTAYYTGDYSGRLTFTWVINNESYRAVVTGDLTLDSSDLHWRCGVSKPTDLESIGNTAFYANTLDTPESQALEYEMLFGDRRIEGSFAMKPETLTGDLQARDIVVDKAVQLSRDKTREPVVTLQP